jgi:hypothetical protein
VSLVFSLTFWKSTAERAVKSFAQALVASLTAVAGLGDVKWGIVLPVAGMTALLSVLTSVASLPVGDHVSPSLLAHPPEESPVPAQRQPGGAAVTAA